MSDDAKKQTRSRWKYMSEPIPDWVSGTMEEKFSAIHQRRFWEETESISGPGSSLAQTRRLIAELPAFWAKLGVASILDIPCGDFNWMRSVDLSRIDYCGADIVPELIELNRRRFGSERARFQRLDFTKDALPNADLIFCRDGFVHLCFSDIWKALENFSRSGALYLMATTFPDLEENRDIETGDWRTLNLEKPPFLFPKPDFILVEGCPEEGFEDKSLGLWRLEDIQCPES